MNKKSKKAIIVSLLVMNFILLTLSLTACGNNNGEYVENTEVETVIKEPIIRVYDDYDTGISIYVDTTTQIMYMHIDGGYDGGTVQLTNADGSPRIYQGEFD